MDDQHFNSAYFNNLDAFRFISFLGVFFSHTLVFPETGHTLTDLALYFISLNYFGVPLFFTLSSFLITYHLINQKSKAGGVFLKQFYRNRILRIWPVYFILVITCFMIVPAVSSWLHIKPMSLPPLSPFLFFYVNFYIISHGSAFTAALLILWSISIEEQFYLTWGPALKFIRNQRLPAFIFILFIISIFFSYYYIKILHGQPGNLSIHSIYVLQNFCTGAFMALLCIQKGKLFAFLQNQPIFFWAAVYLTLPTACFFLKDIVLVNIIKSICFSLVIFDQTFNRHRLFHAGRFRLVNYLGKISYGLYIYHAFVIILLQYFFHFFSNDRYNSIWTRVSEVCIAFIATTVIAHVSYRTIESRFLALKISSVKPSL